MKFRAARISAIIGAIALVLPVAAWGYVYIDGNSWNEEHEEET